MHGIMSLWDNQYLGHILLDAAKLYWQRSRGELKSDLPHLQING